MTSKLAIVTIIILGSLMAGCQATQVPARASIGLECHAFRKRGRKSRLVVDKVLKRGAAFKAGIKVGDMLVRIDNNQLVSEDDLNDFLSVTKPGTEIVLCFMRGGAEKKASVKLGVGKNQAAVNSFKWDYAGLAQLDRAFEQAGKEGREVLVGLCGSEC